MNVEQIEQRFHELKKQREAGEIGDGQFAAEVKKLQFRDEQGRLWRISSTGQWYYEEGGRWVRGKPPRKPKLLPMVLRLTGGVLVGTVLIIAGILVSQLIRVPATPTTVVSAEKTVTPLPTTTPTQSPADSSRSTATCTQVPPDTPSPIPTATMTLPPSTAIMTLPTPVITVPLTPIPTDTPIPVPTDTPTATINPILTDTPTPTPTPTNTPTPAITGKIAFPVFDPQQKTYNIFIANADGTDRRKIEKASQPCFNPEGTWMAYRSWRSDKRELRVADTLGRYLWTITTDSEASRPSVSEGGIVYHRRQALDRPVHVYLFPGSETSKVIRYGDQHRCLPGESPAWVSGEYLVFKSCIGAICGLYLTDGVCDGTGITQLTEDITATNPEASPDGKQVVFMSRCDDNRENWEIYIVHLDTRKVKRLTTHAANDGLPIWSPDGRTIAFASDRNGEWAIWAMNPDGSNQRMLFSLGGSLHGRPQTLQEYKGGGWEEERLSWSP